MKRVIKVWIAGLVALSIGSTAVNGAEVSTDASLMKLIKFAMQERVLIQKATKGYLYAGNDIATTKAQKEMKGALKKFDAKLKTLNSSINDAKMKNLFIFIQSNREEIGDLLKEAYSLENAQEIIDLAEAITEGELSIAKKLIKKLKGEPPVFKGQRYFLVQVAKYYIAYTSGIKDKNTVKSMNKAVKRLGELIEEMKAYHGNTPEMNQNMAKVEKDWKIVHKFYMDIEDGDLPLIVYDTTSKMDKLFFKYFQGYLKVRVNKK